MSEHTPGPWKRSELGRGNDIIPVKSFRVGAIATVFLRNDSREQEANAHLIASAPDLVAILIEYERIEAEIIFDDECWDAELPQHYYDRLIDLQHLRNAALEKAGHSCEMRAKAGKGEGGES